MAENSKKWTRTGEVLVTRNDLKRWRSEGRPSFMVLDDGTAVTIGSDTRAGKRAPAYSKAAAQKPPGVIRDTPQNDGEGT